MVARTIIQCPCNTAVEDSNPQHLQGANQVTSTLIICKLQSTAPHPVSFRGTSTHSTDSGLEVMEMQFAYCMQPVISDISEVQRCGLDPPVRDISLTPSMEIPWRTHGSSWSPWTSNSSSIFIIATNMIYERSKTSSDVILYIIQCLPSVRLTELVRFFITRSKSAHLRSVLVILRWKGENIIKSDFNPNSNACMLQVVMLTSPKRVVRHCDRNTLLTLNTILLIALLAPPKLVVGFGECLYSLDAL